ncbi:MAG: NUDIX hydrolase [Acidimicrobiia bacterium]
MTGRHEVWDGQRQIVSVPTSGGENVMIPVIRGVIRSVEDPDLVLLQRRDNPKESVRGLLELPGGRWRAAESPVDALKREIHEETGVAVSSVNGVVMDDIDDHRTVASVSPLAVIAGVRDAYPAIHVVLMADGSGDPVDAPGESADVRWWRIDAIRNAMANNREEFVPSTYAALTAYVDWLASVAGS